MDTITEVLDFLRRKDYLCNFELNDECLICKETGEQFTKNDLIIDELYRFEGDSNPDDMSVIYAVRAKSGTKGILVDAYGTYSDPEISAFIKDVPKSGLD